MVKRQRALAAPLSVAMLLATGSIARAEQDAAPVSAGTVPAEQKEQPTQSTNTLPVEPTAKIAPVTNPRPPRSVSVLERERPKYDADGVAIGSYTFYPSVRSSFAVTDNIYKQPDGQSAIYLINRLDARLTGAPTAFQLYADGFLQQTTYNRFTSEDTFTYRTRGGLKAALNPDFSTRANAIRERVAIARNGVGEVVNNLRPTRYDRTGFDLSARNLFNQFSLQAAYAYDDIRFLNNIDPVGNARSERLRSYKRNTFELRSGIFFAPDTEAFALVSHETRRFAVASSPIRDVNISKAVAGLEGDLTPVIHGRMDVGALRTNFTAPSIKDSTDVTFDMELNFFVTELTTLTLSGDRRLLNVANAATAAALGTSIALRADHELYRNVILSAEVTYGDARYLASSARAKAYTFDIGAQWLVSRRIKIFAAGRYEGRATDGFDINRDFNSFSANAGIQLAL